jgi:hypothetical protein
MKLHHRVLVVSVLLVIALLIGLQMLHGNAANFLIVFGPIALIVVWTRERKALGFWRYPLLFVLILCWAAVLRFVSSVID